MTRGTIRFRITGKEADAVEGQRVVVPAGTPHSWWNASDVEVTAKVCLRPALNSETAFETLFGLARDGKTNKQGLPNIFQLAVITTYFKETKVLIPPPVGVLLKLLTPLARLLGYRASYPQYSSAQQQNCWHIHKVRQEKETMQCQPKTTRRFCAVTMTK